MLRLDGFNRQEHYAAVKKGRGEKAARELIDEVNRQWRMSSHNQLAEGQSGGAKRNSGDCAPTSRLRWRRPDGGNDR